MHCDKHSPIVAKMKEIIDREYEDGRTTTMSDDELTRIYAVAKDSIENSEAAE